MVAVLSAGSVAGNPGFDGSSVRVYSVVKALSAIVDAVADTVIQAGTSASFVPPLAVALSLMDEVPVPTVYRLRLLLVSS